MHLTESLAGRGILRTFRQTDRASFTLDGLGCLRRNFAEVIGATRKLHKTLPSAVCIARLTSRDHGLRGGRGLTCRTRLRTDGSVVSSLVHFAGIIGHLHQWRIRIAEPL